MTRVSLLLGAVLWAAATALLLDDAWRAGHLAVAHALMPILTASTVGAAVLFHHYMARLRLLAALGFLLLAVMGSLLTIYSTLGRTAEARDQRVATAEANNRSLATKQQSLADARRMAQEAESEVGRECRDGFGKKCAGWTSTLASRQQDARRIEAELSSMQSTPIDARADAVVRLAVLLGASDEAWLRKLIAALDPIMLPLFLEIGSIVGFAAGFPRPKARESVCEDEDGVSEGGESDSHDAPTTRDDALRDLRGLLASGAVCDGRMLSRRWNVSETTTSRWMGTWQRQGLIGRARDGRSKRPMAAS